MTNDKVWMRPNDGHSEPQEFDGKPEILVPLMVSGWSQCDPPAKETEEKRSVDD